MISALKFEWTRLTTLRSTWWLSFVCILLSASVAGLMAAFVSDKDFDRYAGVLLMGGTGFSPVPFVAMFMALIGIFAFGHEYRHGLVLPTLTAVPRRSALVTAKLLVTAIWATLITAVSVGVNWGLAAVLGGQTIDLFGAGVGAEAMGGYVGYVVLWAVLGLGLAGLLRGIPSAIVVVLVVPLLIEPVLMLLGALVQQLEWLGDLMVYAPFAAGGRMYVTDALAEFTGGGGAVIAGGVGEAVEMPSRLASTLTFGGWVALVLAFAWVLFQRRDA